MIFKCMKCGCGENSALCNYWESHYNHNIELCSECDPKIGKWHGHFTKQKYQEVKNE